MRFLMIVILMFLKFDRTSVMSLAVKILKVVINSIHRKLTQIHSPAVVSKKFLIIEDNVQVK